MELDPKETIRINEKASPEPWTVEGKYRQDANYYLIMPNGRRFKMGDAIYHDTCEDEQAIVHNTTAAPEYAKRIEKALAQVEELYEQLDYRPGNDLLDEVGRIIGILKGEANSD